MFHAPGFASIRMTDTMGAMDWSEAAGSETRRKREHWADRPSSAGRGLTARGLDTPRRGESQGAKAVGAPRITLRREPRGSKPMARTAGRGWPFARACSTRLVAARGAIVSTLDGNICSVPAPSLAAKGSNRENAPCSLTRQKRARRLTAVGSASLDGPVPAGDRPLRRACGRVGCAAVVRARRGLIRAAGVRKSREQREDILLVDDSHTCYERWLVGAS
jgi:hypothetical protein